MIDHIENNHFERSLLRDVADVDVMVLATVEHVFEVSSPTCDESKPFIGRFLMVDIQGNVRVFRGMWGG